MRALSQYEPFGTMLLGVRAPDALPAGDRPYSRSCTRSCRTRKVQLRAALDRRPVRPASCGRRRGMIFTSFVVESTRTMVIYAGFAIVIVALIWLHVSWLILLLGAQLVVLRAEPAVPAARPRRDPRSTRACASASRCRSCTSS